MATMMDAETKEAVVEVSSVDNTEHNDEKRNYDLVRPGGRFMTDRIVHWSLPLLD